MHPDRFLTDLEAKPTRLRELAEALDDGLVAGVDLAVVRRLVCTGMGSSRFAALPVTSWLRARGIDAVAEYASLETPHPGGPDTLVVGVSATGASKETVGSLAARGPGTRRLAITNRPGPLADAADAVVDLHAGEEVGGVACRTFQHTLAVLLALAVRLAGDGPDVAAACRKAAEATADLLERRDRWLPAVAELLAEGPSSYLIAPAERRSSAEQAALMLREGPRRPADACETGDWCHVDVYLSLPLDYRCVLFTGSRYDGDAIDWLTQREVRWVAVGGERPGAAVTLRYRHDDDPVVALLTEVLVGELVAARWWGAAAGSSAP